MLKKSVFIDAADADMRENMRWRGAGMVSANNSSRLMLDYKSQSPNSYWKIMELTFGKSGLCVSHLKVEMGSDVNSSSGTEPCIMRSAEEKPDITRGAGFQLAADAKKINPNLTLDMLWWSEPRWVSDSENVFEARYEWYKRTLIAAYEAYGLKFDYVSAVQNERDADLEWVKYLAASLRGEKNCPYDFSKIKIVGGEEVCTWNFADNMLQDSELMEAVDVIGSHYTSRSTENAQVIANEIGKELWFSEASSPMAYAEGARRFNKSGLSGINGALDIANRVIAMYPQGKMTLHEYQPVISAYYDGVCYCHKSLITACQPFNGSFVLENGFYTTLHFSQFIPKGWRFIKNACYCDGVAGGDGHAMVEAKFSYLTAVSPNFKDYSIVITNTLQQPIKYSFTVNGINTKNKPLNVWETRGESDMSKSLDSNFFVKKGIISILTNDKLTKFDIAIQPMSIVTITTLEPKFNKPIQNSANDIFALPYRDDFRYSDKPANFLHDRGGAPLYTTDQGGAFEVKNGALVQQITQEMRANEWGYTPEPTTTLGDDRWFDYSVSADVEFAPSDDPKSSYVGIGLRHILACDAMSGYSLRLYESKNWQLIYDDSIIASGFVPGFGRLILSIQHDLLRAYVGNQLVIEYRVPSSLSIAGAGRAALYSSYNKNSFKNLEIEPLRSDDAYTYAERFDDTDMRFEYFGRWEHELMSSFKNYKRTLSKGTVGDSLTFKFTGRGFGIMGAQTGTSQVEMTIGDGEQMLITPAKSKERAITCRAFDLSKGEHTVAIKVISGDFYVDGAEVYR